MSDLEMGKSEMSDLEMGKSEVVDHFGRGPVFAEGGVVGGVEEGVGVRLVDGASGNVVLDEHEDLALELEQVPGGERREVRAEARRLKGVRDLLVTRDLDREDDAGHEQRADGEGC